MERPRSTSSPTRRNSNTQLLQELEVLSQSLCKSHQQPRRGGSLTLSNAKESRGFRESEDTINQGIPLPGLANARQAGVMPSKNVRHSMASPRTRPTSGVSDSELLDRPSPKARFSTSTVSHGIADNVEIRDRRRRNSLSPFRWRRDEQHNSADHDNGRNNFCDRHEDGIDDFERKLEQSAEKSKGFWTWKPMRALSHIGLQRFTCMFSVYVNAMEDLSTSMNGLRLAVNLRKKETKEGAVQTMPCRVFDGSAEFDESLHIRCHVYGGKSGSQGFKFQSRPFTISVVALDAEELDLGWHQMDLSMLLHETERIHNAGEECNGWNANFDLWGKARGGKLIVSLGFEIVDKDGHATQIGNTNARFRDSGSHRDSRISKSLPNSARGTPKNLPVGFSYEHMASSSYSQSEPGDREMLNLIRMEQFNLNDNDEAIHSKIPPAFENLPQGSFGDAKGGSSSEMFSSCSSLQSQNMAPPEHGLGQLGNFEEREENIEGGYFEVVEQGLEIQGVVEEMQGTAMDSVEKLDNKDKEEEEEERGEIVKEVVQEGQQSKRLSDLESIFQQINALESVILEKTRNELSTESLDQNPPNEALEDVEAKKDSDVVIKSNEKEKSILDEDEVDLVAGEFLHMLEEEDEDAEFGNKESSKSYIPNEDDMELAFMLEAAQTELQKATQSLDSKRRATLLEDAETEALMQEWGLNEEVFQNSPSKADSTGFGNRHVKFPDLGEGLGSVVHTRDGGMLASMDPGHFRTGVRLVMHVSKPVVVPAEMGDNAVEVLQRMAGMGIASIAAQANACMQLDDITGKTVEQIAFEGMASAITKHGHSEQKVGLGLKDQAKGTLLAGSRKPKHAGLQITENVNEEYVSLESIAPVAMQNIEAMALEGLKIQAEMTEEEAPYTLPPVPLPKHGKLGQLLEAASDKDDAASNSLMDMSISLEEWTRLDTGLHEKEQEKERKTRAVLAAPRANGHKNKEQGYMGNSLTIALLVQLRDPLRNYEAVGSPMIALVQAERVKVPVHSIISKAVSINVQSEEEDEEDQRKFKIKGVHLSGLKLKRDRDEKKSVWGTEKQYQTGSRWLLSNGMGKNTKHPSIKSELRHPQTKAKQGEFIWSITSRLDTASSQKSKNSNRNPDVVFPKRSVWRG